MLDILNCLVRSAIERERQAEIAVGSSEIRVEFERASIFVHRLIGLSLRKGHPRQRHVSPWVAVVELRRPRSELRRFLNLRLKLRSGPNHPAPHRKHEGW